MEHYDDLASATVEVGRLSKSWGGGPSKLDNGGSDKAELLLSMGFTSKVVSQQLGYADVTGFRRAWLARYCMSPTQWQRKRGVKVRRAKPGNPCLRPRKTWTARDKRRRKAKLKQLREDIWGELSKDVI